MVRKLVSKNDTCQGTNQKWVETCDTNFTAGVKSKQQNGPKRGENVQQDWGEVMKQPVGEVGGFNRQWLHEETQLYLDKY